MTTATLSTTTRPGLTADLLEETAGASGLFPLDLTLPEDREADLSRVREAAVMILGQGEALLLTLTTASYVRKVPAVFNASMGGHYRHCLDHFSSLLDGLGLGLGWVDYDHRERDGRVEGDPGFALELTRRLRHQVEQLPLGFLDAPVRARCEVSYEHGNSPVAMSTAGRELVYCIAHAIHHYALISVMARLLEVALPGHFGVAPSTVAHQAKAGRG